MKQIHLMVGVVTVVLFLGTGVYMRMEFPELYAEHEVIRFLFRANHVYILFSGLLNVVAGLYMFVSEIPRKRTLQRAGSWLLLASSPTFLLAFAIEPMQANPMRPLTVTAAFMALVGVALHFLANAVPSQQAKN